MSLLDEVKQLDEVFNEAPEPAGGSQVPDGTYYARVDSLELKKSQAGKLMLKWDLVIEGDQPTEDLDQYQGVTLHRNNMLESSQNLGYLKKDLKACGVDVHREGFALSQFLDEEMDSLLDLVVEIQVRTTKKDGNTNQNIYINGLADGGSDVDTSEKTTSKGTGKGEKSGKSGMWDEE
jgi:hypothetical protein